MVIGIGIDLLELGRLEPLLARHGERFVARVFRDGEIPAGSPAQRLQRIGARFAAKEACLKALGTGWAAGLAPRQIEVRRDAAGRPELRLHGAALARARDLGVTRAHVSLTHQPGVVGALVVLEGSDPS